VVCVCSLDLEFGAFLAREQLEKKRSGGISERCACLDYVHAHSYGIYQREGWCDKGNFSC